MPVSASAAIIEAMKDVVPELTAATLLDAGDHARSLERARFKPLADLTRAESTRLDAKGRADDSAARLTSATAISNTLSIQAAQVQRLTDSVIESSRVWQVVTMALAGALCLLLAIVVLAILRRPTARPVVYMLSDRPAQAPALPPAASWPEQRALIRARRELAVTRTQVT